MPGNADILKTYFQLVAQEKIIRNKQIELTLRKRAIRSQSGIVPVQVLTKPFWCPWECIFCPNDATMPKSYINTEPGAQRALLNNFDPYKQVFNRLLSLTLTGHETDKIEMIVLGGTRDVYPKQYKIDFVKGLYDACNAFEKFFEWYIEGSIKVENTKSIEYETLDIEFPKSIAESISLNEKAMCRIIWLTIETRPEYVTDENCQLWRDLGVTRIEMGIQNMFDDVLDANKRGHSVEQCREAMFKLRQYGFKISVHLMPGLYKSNKQKDIDTFRIAFEDPAFRPDELKFYPTAIIPNTELFNLYKRWEYKALTLQENKDIIKEVLVNFIPPYTRIKRLIRDIPAEETVATDYVTNLRQLVENELTKEYQAKTDQERSTYYQKMYNDLTFVSNEEEMLEKINHFTQNSSDYNSFITLVPKDTQLDFTSTRNFICFDTRSREIRNQAKSVVLIPVIRIYNSTNGVQLFMSFEDELGYLYWFTRLQLGSSELNSTYAGLGENSAIIRELHVYGQVAKIKTSDEEDKTQHQGIGTQLMELSSKIATHCGYDKLSVISGVGVRKYYEKLGYHLVWTYLVKNLT